jgi:hypothetical protein
VAILLPTNYSTFGDATRTEGKGPLRKYVLAQFRSDANLEWMGRLRAALGSIEVKFKQFKDRRVEIRKDTNLWKMIEKGVGAATLIVIDPEPVDHTIRTGYERDGARQGVDFGDAEVASRAATALVAGTPLAWLPNELAKVVGREIVTLERFAPERIRQRIGQELRAATVFAARAHATFDVATMDETVRSTRDVYRSPIATVILREVISIPRIFDEESRETVQLLNDASDQIADALVEGLPSTLSLSSEPLVREADSRAIDQIQAADVAAGWAREVIDTAGVRALGTRFERIWVNGDLMKGPELALYDIRER